VRFEPQRESYESDNLITRPLTRYVELKSLEASHNAIEIANEDQVASYYKIRQQLDNLGKQLLSYIQKPQYLLPFLQPGRLVKVCD